MKDIALGWTLAGTCLPAPLRLMGCGNTQLITAPEAQAGTPRQRLMLQQACFDAGIGMIPVSADQPVCAEQAGIPPPDLLTQLARLQGCWQLSLTLSWKTPLQVQPQASGQSWLKMRQRRLIEAAAISMTAQETFFTLVSRLPHPKSQLRRAADRFSLDLLVARTDLSRIHDTLTDLGQRLAIDALPGAHLLATGLWPPFSFVRAGQDQLAVA